MANNKRKRPKHQRSGCLLCKPHKDERLSKKNRTKPKNRNLEDYEEKE